MKNGESIDYYINDLDMFAQNEEYCYNLVETLTEDTPYEEIMSIAQYIANLYIQTGCTNENLGSLVVKGFAQLLINDYC